MPPLLGRKPSLIHSRSLCVPTVLDICRHGYLPPVCRRGIAASLPLKPQSMADKKRVRSAAGYDNERQRGHARAVACLDRKVAPTEPATTTTPGAPHTGSYACDPRSSTGTLRRHSSASEGLRCAPSGAPIPEPRSAPTVRNREVNIYTPNGCGYTWITRGLVRRHRSSPATSNCSNSVSTELPGL